MFQPCHDFQFGFTFLNIFHCVLAKFMIIITNVSFVSCRSMVMDWHCVSSYCPLNWFSFHSTSYLHVTQQVCFLVLGGYIYIYIMKCFSSVSISKSTKPKSMIRKEQENKFKESTKPMPFEFEAKWYG